MKTSAEDTVSFFGANLTAHTLPNATGSTVLPGLSYPQITWPQYNPDLEPYAPKITGPQVTRAPEQADKSGSQYYPKRLSNAELHEKLFPPTTLTELENMKKATTAVKHDTGKADWSLMPWEAVEEINKVLAFGAQKYAAHNWQQGTGFKYTRVLNSLLRHVFAYMRGEDLDPESGLSHMAHAGCNVLFLLHYNKNKSRYKNDDRYVP